VLIQDLAGFVKAQTLDKKITIADENVYVGITVFSSQREQWEPLFDWVSSLS
jgi:hypothetical protein